MNNNLPPELQLILRNTDKITGKSLLVIDPPDNTSVNTFERVFHDLTFFSRDYSVYSRSICGLKEPGSIIFDSWYTPPQFSYDVILLYLPKGKDYMQMTLGMISNCIAYGSQDPVRIFVVGSKKAGIISCKATLERWFGKVMKIEAARHGALFCISAAQNRCGKHLLLEWETSWELILPGKKLTILSYPGVFCSGRIDEGTKHLIKNILPPRTGRLLDMGCGNGIVGAMVAKEYPGCTVEMVDTNSIAVVSTKRTVEANNLRNVHCYPSDLYSDVRGKFDMIFANPPFHSGVPTDYSMVQSLIFQAAEYLRPDGRLKIVANRFLRYLPLLKQVFRRARIEYEDGNYRVYEAYSQI